MILGLGLDIVELSRMQRSWERFGERLAARILHPEELTVMHTKPAAQFLASRFAAKEAAVKALGTGFAEGIAFTDIAVYSLPSGQPYLRLYGNAHTRMEMMEANRIHLSLTHSKETVAAVVIIEQTQEARNV